MPNEIWKIVLGLGGYYEASNLGRIRRAKPGPRTYVGRLMTPRPDQDGYLKVCIHCPVRRGPTSVHRMVAAAFHGECPTDLQVNHKDGVKTNNVPDNLEYVSCRSNILHSLRKGLRAKLQWHRVHGVKLTPAKVRRILKAQGHVGAYQLAQEFGVAPQIIYRIWKRVIWTHVHE